MPSPVAHSLAGLAAAQYGRQRQWIGASGVWLLAFVVAANAADLDFLPGLLVGHAERYHHGPSHSLIAAAAVGVVAWLVAELARVRAARLIGLLFGAAYLSHLVLDLVSGSTFEPTDMALVWPFGDVWIVAPVQLFGEVHHSETVGFIQSLFRWDNLLPIAREVLVMSGLWMTARVLSRARLPLPEPIPDGD
jgi:inner membrane protein